MFNVEVSRFKEIKFLNSCQYKKFLKSDGVKSNYKNMMKSNGGIPSYHESEIEGTCFFLVIL